jgi:hypothetical protein
MGPDHHRVFMYTPDLSVSNQKDSPQRQTAILSEEGAGGCAEQATTSQLCRRQDKEIKNPKGTGCG